MEERLVWDVGLVGSFGGIGRRRRVMVRKVEKEWRFVPIPEQK